MTAEASSREAPARDHGQRALRRAEKADLALLALPTFALALIGFLHGLGYIAPRRSRHRRSRRWSVISSRRPSAAASGA